MPTFLHAADLHLSTSSSERGYGLQVLEEIAAIAGRQNVDAILLAGDIFDTFEAASSLRQAFIERLQAFTKPIVYIPGNHEDTGVGFTNLKAFDWRPLKLCADLPFMFLPSDELGFEMVTVPHQRAHPDHQQWKIPAKKPGVCRVLLSHGMVPGMSFQGLEVEPGGQLLDPQIFSQFDVDYVALGHIHGARQMHFGKTLCAYPGSSRVWRHGETGSRKVNLVRTEGSVARAEAIPLLTAGEYRVLPLTIALDGQLPRISERYAAADWLHLIVAGFISDEITLKALEEQWQNHLTPPPRRVTFDHSQVIFSQKLRNNPLVKEYLKFWEELKPTPDTPDYAWNQQVWLKAREKGLSLIRDRLEVYL